MHNVQTSISCAAPVSSLSMTHLRQHGGLQPQTADEMAVEDSSILEIRAPTNTTLEVDTCETGDHDLGHDHLQTSSSLRHKGELNVYEGATLLVADCLGTGILALPAVVVVLGRTWGFAFLILQLPINLYAGTILCHSADVVDAECHEQIKSCHTETINEGHFNHEGLGSELVERIGGKPNYRSKKSNYKTVSAIEIEEEEFVDEDIPSLTLHVVDDHSSSDLIGITRALFPNSTTATLIVMSIYYGNLFLLLGDYILVMSHAVVALMGDAICLPMAGIVASTLMYVASQLRTMASFGRSLSILSLAALLLVIIQCLIFLTNLNDNWKGFAVAPSPVPVPDLVIPKFSGLASIAFACGSQKLLLNIRSEMKHKKAAPRSLAICLASFVTLYVLICVLAGQNPPSFLFDAIPPGWNRRLSGFFLWIHVVISYAINSQAMCSSMDRLFLSNIMPHHSPALRWMLLTFGVSLSSYIVANAIPFFKDLVSLIGALTAIPLSLILPTVLFRKAFGIRATFALDCSASTMFSTGLLIFSIVFTLIGLVGSVWSIQRDWSNHGPPFSCY